MFDLCTPSYQNVGLLKISSNKYWNIAWENRRSWHPKKVFIISPFLGRTWEFIKSCEKMLSEGPQLTALPKEVWWNIQILLHNDSILRIWEYVECGSEWRFIMLWYSSILDSNWCVLDSAQSKEFCHFKRFFKVSINEYNTLIFKKHPSGRSHFDISGTSFRKKSIWYLRNILPEEVTLIFKEYLSGRSHFDI